jgi:hypothetical protein
LSRSTSKSAIAGAKWSANFFGFGELAVDAASIAFVALYAVQAVSYVLGGEVGEGCARIWQGC